MAYLFRALVVYLVLLVFLFISSSTTTTAAGARELRINVKVTKSFVYEVCSQTRNINFCVDVLRSDPRTETSDLFGLGSIANNLAIINATDTQNYITDLFNNATLDQKDHFHMCSLDYQFIISDFKQAADKMRHSDYKETNTLAIDAINRASDCENVFLSPPVIQSPLTQRNKNLGDLADILAAVSKRLS
ncbi:Pectinesterase inhibitor domain [Macleaya cordata]|uniref:Pectinesterase inhibitor domain n=1 Tax=Macleaya cordata TaxID=56857 RepID=A0A200R1T5_MACCD|nr:Pectinesterase inhibitor domain [Macleaya cordata]